MEQEGVDQPLGTQDDDPGIGTDQEIDPERDHHQDDPGLLPFFGQDHGDGIGYRIPHGKSPECGDKCGPQSKGEDLQVQGFQEAEVVFQVPLEDHLSVGRPGSKGNHHHNQERQGKEKPQPSHGRKHQQFAPSHFVTWTPSWVFHQIPTRSSTDHFR